MAQALARKDQWFVVHVLSGQENKVRDNIEKRVKTEEMGDVIFEVLVPTERVSEIKRGKKSETTRKFFPGYLIVEHAPARREQSARRAHLVFHSRHARRDRFCWHERQTDPDAAIGGRQHARANARARREGETEGQLRSRRTVKVADGPFQNQTGIVEEIDPDRGKLRVSVTIFGRATPVELEYWQVERG